MKANNVEWRVASVATSRLRGSFPFNVSRYFLLVLFAAQKADPLNLKGEPARGRDRSRGQDAN